MSHAETSDVLGFTCKYLFVIQINYRRCIEISVLIKQELRRTMLRERQVERSVPEAAMQYSSVELVCLSVYKFKDTFSSSSV